MRGTFVDLAVLPGRQHRQIRDAEATWAIPPYLVIPGPQRWWYRRQKTGRSWQQSTPPSVVAEDGEANAGRGGSWYMGFLEEGASRRLLRRGRTDRSESTSVTVVKAMVTSKVPSIVCSQQARHHWNYMEATPLPACSLQSSELWRVFSSTEPHRVGEQLTVHRLIRLVPFVVSYTYRLIEC